MTTKPKFKSDAFAAIHASATALQKVGAIDQTTMRQFDDSCLAVPSTLAPTEIKIIREGLQRKVAQIAPAGDLKKIVKPLWQWIIFSIAHS